MQMFEHRSWPSQTKRESCLETKANKRSPSKLRELVPILETTVLGISSRLNCYIFVATTTAASFAKDKNFLISCHLFEGRAPWVHPKDCRRRLKGKSAKNEVHSSLVNISAIAGWLVWQKPKKQAISITIQIHWSIQSVRHQQIFWKGECHQY